MAINITELNTDLANKADLPMKANRAQVVRKK